MPPTAASGGSVCPRKSIASKSTFASWLGKHGHTDASHPYLLVALVVWTYPDSVDGVGLVNSAIQQLLLLSHQSGSGLSFSALAFSRMEAGAEKFIKSSTADAAPCTASAGFAGQAVRAAVALLAACPTS